MDRAYGLASEYCLRALDVRPCVDCVEHARALLDGCKEAHAMAPTTKVADRQECDVVRVAAQMADTLRAVLSVVDAERPYPWRGGALKQQIREDLTVFELLELDAEAQMTEGLQGELGS